MTEKAALLLQRIGNQASLLQSHLQDNDDEKATLETQAWKWIRSIRSDTAPVNLDEDRERQREQQRIEAAGTLGASIIFMVGLFYALGMSWYQNNR